MNTYEKRNSLLGMEFHRYLREHSDFTDKVPDNAQVILKESRKKLRIPTRHSLTMHPTNFWLRLDQNCSIRYGRRGKGDPGLFEEEERKYREGNVLFQPAA